MRRHRSALLALAATLAAVPATAQTRFAWPDTAVDVSTYTTVQECYAAALRVQELVSLRELRTRGVWRDTVTFDPAELHEAGPAAVAETAQRCLRRFADVDSVSLDGFAFLLPLYLAAGWDDRAGALAERRLAAVAREDEAARGAVVDTVVAIYLAEAPWNDVVKPPRIGLAHAFASKHTPLVADRVQRFQIYVKFLPILADMARERADTARAQDVVARLVGIADSLTEAERELLAEKAPLLGGGDDVAQQIYGIYSIYFGEDAALDSLRRSTAAFVNLRRTLWVRATGRPPETFGWGMPIGEQASPIEADIWLGRDDGGEPRPTAGRISLVAFLANPECRGRVNATEEVMYAPEVCVAALVGLRRLAERFPTLDITVVARTYGHFKYIKDGITPEREAELTKRWLESFGVKAPLAMAITDAWWLPAPDRRRIEPADVNTTHYTFGKSWRLDAPVEAFLVDEDGIIIHAGSMGRDNRDFTRLIEVLLERQRAGQ